MDTRNFSRHIRLREKVNTLAVWPGMTVGGDADHRGFPFMQANDAQKLEELLHEEFDYKLCAEPLEDRIKKAGRRAGTYYSTGKKANV
jgi:hypothetical protein